MFKREIKINFKSFIIWFSILIGLFLIVFLIYPSIIDNENMKMLEEMMKIFPQELLTAFNMDISTIDSAYGWLKSEGFVFVLLITGCYSAILGANILLKEESDKTIEYLNSLPINRNQIVLNKVLAGLIYIFLMIIGLGLFNFIGLSLSGDFNKTQYVLLSITPIFSSVSLYFICMFLATFTHKQKKMMGISLGIVFISYILQSLSTISTKVEFLKYFSVFSLADVRNVLVNISLNPIIIILSFVISIIFWGLIIIRYNKKELI